MNYIKKQLNNYRNSSAVFAISGIIALLYASVLGCAPAFALAAATSSSSGVSLSATSRLIPHYKDAISGSTSIASQNWSGYIASTASTSYSAVSGSWIVPSVAASSSPSLSADATWVGIGGLNSSDLIQSGTQAIVSNDQVTYQAWYEMLPQASTAIPLAIKAGDSITVSVSEQSPDQWMIFFLDSTTGEHYQTTVSYTSSLSSAEWIQELPSISISGASGTNGYGRSSSTSLSSSFNLDQFGSVQFTGGTAVELQSAANSISTANPTSSIMSIAQSGAQPMTMINNLGQAIAIPSAIGTNGSSFTVFRSENQSAQSIQSATITRITPTAGQLGGQIISPQTRVSGAYTNRGWIRTGVGIRGYSSQQSVQKSVQIGNIDVVRSLRSE